MPEAKRAKNYRGKCMLCGDSTVGKSALSQVFCSDGSQYPKSYLMTTGVDMVVKNVHIPDTNDIVEMFLYDLGGKDCYDDVIMHHLAQAEMTLIVYDVTNVDSFNDIDKWFEKIASSRGVDNKKVVPCALVANKIDLESRRVVSDEEGSILASKLGVPFYACSAKEFNGVEPPFLHLAAKYYENIMKERDI